MRSPWVCHPKTRRAGFSGRQGVSLESLEQGIKWRWTKCSKTGKRAVTSTDVLGRLRG